MASSFPRSPSREKVGLPTPSVSESLQSATKAAPKKKASKAAQQNSKSAAKAKTPKQKKYSKKTSIDVTTASGSSDEEGKDPEDEDVLEEWQKGDPSTPQAHSVHRKPPGPRLPSRPQIPGGLKASNSGSVGIVSSTGGVSGPERVFVCLRAKPPLPETLIYDMDESQGLIKLNALHPTLVKRGGIVAGREGETSFSVDHLHLPPHPTKSLYDNVVSPLVKSSMDGFNATVFAYGMTGSGKTWTMTGNDSQPGVIPSSIDEVFDLIESSPNRSFLLRVTYLEVYNEELRDLLGSSSHPSKKLQVREGNKKVYVDGLEQVVVKSPEEILDCLKRGEKNRRVGATDWNEHSSRSHTIFSILIESKPSESAPVSGSIEDASEIRFSSLNLCDLAGSEKAASDGERLKEGSYINKSLLELSNVITQLSTSQAHVSYRNSKLTRVLQDSLSGRARIAVICTISLDEKHAAEGHNTLKFAGRVARVTTKAERGSVMSDKALIQQYQNEVADLRKKLEELSSISPSALPPPTPMLSEQSEQSSDSESEENNNEAMSETRKELELLQGKRKKYEEEVQLLAMERTKLKTQITSLSGLILTSADSGVDGVSQKRNRRRLSDLPGIGLGNPMTPKALPGKRVFSAAVPVIGKREREWVPNEIRVVEETEVVPDRSEVIALEKEVERLNSLLLQSDTGLLSAHGELNLLRQELSTLKLSVSSESQDQAASLQEVERLKKLLHQSDTGLLLAHGEIESQRQEIAVTKDGVLLQFQAQAASIDNLEGILKEVRSQAALEAESHNQNLAAVAEQLAAKRDEVSALQEVANALRNDNILKSNQLKDFEAQQEKLQLSCEASEAKANQLELDLQQQQQQPVQFPKSPSFSRLQGQFQAEEDSPPSATLPKSPSFTLRSSNSMKETRSPAFTGSQGGRRLVLSAEADSSPRTFTPSKEGEEIANLNLTVRLQKDIIAKLQEALDDWYMKVQRQGVLIRHLMNGMNPEEIEDLIMAEEDATKEMARPAISSSSAPFDNTQPQQPATSPLVVKELSINQLARSSSSTQLAKAPKLRDLATFNNPTPSASPVTAAKSSGGGGLAFLGKPPPLPMSGSQIEKSNSRARALRRITIQRDMDKLKESSSVDTKRGLFNNPSTPTNNENVFYNPHNDYSGTQVSPTKSNTSFGRTPHSTARNHLRTHQNEPIGSRSNSGSVSSLK